MNRFICFAIPALLAACTVTTDNTPEPGTGAVDFTWTFDAPNGGSTCADADVQQIQITISGSAPVTVPCNDWASGNGQSTTIDDVPAGALSYTIAGLSFTYDDNGNVTGTVTSYTGTFSSSVPAGGVDEEVITLNPESTPETNSNLVFLWSFAGLTCTEADVATVNITITDPTNSANGYSGSAPCSQNGTDGAAVTMFGAGSYSFVLTASGTSGPYYASGTIYANGYSDTTANIDLGQGTTPTSGAGTLNVNFSFGSSASGCTASGVGTLEYYLTDGTGAVVSGTFTNESCTDPIPVATFTGLTSPATYFLNAEGQSGGATTYELLQYAVEVYPDVTSTYSIEIPAVSSF